MRPLLPVVLAILATHPNVSMAGYVNNYSQWKQLSSQAAYAMGLYDAESTYIKGGMDWENAAANGLFNCGMEFDLTGGVLAEAINNYYVANPQMWSEPPIIVFSDAIMRGVCLDHINTERAKVGLEQWLSPE